jgi:hypothetical protein
MLAKMAADEGGIEWLYELLQDVQLEQFFTRIRDDLQVISFCKRKICLNMKNDSCRKVSRKQFSLWGTVNFV